MARTTQTSGPRVLFLVTEDWFFRTHRLPLARACRDAGAEVFVMTHLNKPADDLVSEGFHLVPWRVTRGGTNPVIECQVLRQVARAYWRIRPDLVHHVALKPVIYGGIVARMLGIPAVNAITGLGVVFTSASLRMRLLRGILKKLLSISMRRTDACTIFQTKEDMQSLVDDGIVQQSNSSLIRGSGVDTEQFVSTPEPSGTPLVLLPTRMIWSKGVGVFIDSVKLLRQRHVEARFALVGDPDQQNPDGVSIEQLSEWHSDGVAEWWRHRNDMPSVFAQSSIVVFPSYYGEGVPKVLLEAAASGRATITTNSPGCRDAVRNGENGLLVPRKDVVALADAIQYLLANPRIRCDMGKKGRQIAVEEFSVEKVIAETKLVYRQLLNSDWPSLNVVRPMSATQTF